MPTFSGRLNRIAIVGATGSGKTTLGEQLSTQLGIPLIDLDALHWLPNWTITPVDEFQEKVQIALSGNRWVTAGNYSRVRQMIWERAEMVVWLDYPLPLVFWRLFKRTIRRIITREKLWGGNRETFRTQFLSRDSLFLWLFQTYPRRKREYALLMSLSEYSHLHFERLTHPKYTRIWLQEMISQNRS